MKTLPLVSIIIPIYGVEKYLNKCISSVLAQTYSKFELILIDDASIDKSSDICKMFSKKDPRIVYYRKPQNEGVDKARFTGIKKATGKYITFIDGDDWFSKTAIEEMVEGALETNADVVETCINRVFDSYGILNRKDIKNKKFISNPELFQDYYLSFFGVNILLVNMCGHLYKRELIEKANIEPSGFKMGEDLIFNMKLFPYISSYFIIDKCSYNYRFGGMTSKYNPNLLDDLKKQFIIKLKTIENYKYYKAQDYIRIEMMNILKSDILQRMTFSCISPDLIKEAITNEIADPIYDIATDLKKEWDSAFYRALRKKDVDELYNIVHSQYLNERKNRIIKRIISNILKII